MAIGEIDLVEIIFTLFWLFFIGLVIYIRREDKREGYPLDSDRTHNSGGRVQVVGFPGMAPAKRFALPHGGYAESGRAEPPDAKIAAEPAAGYPGAPLVPTGNPMLDGVGPGAYSNRADVPEKTMHNENRIVPMRVDAEFYFSSRDPDPRGMAVIGADGETGGTVTDAWVDRSEPLLTFFELETASGKHVLLPVNFTRVKRAAGEIHVNAILGAQFEDVPALASPDQITLLEEDKICAYYGGGTLYATPERQEPLV